MFQFLRIVTLATPILFVFQLTVNANELAGSEWGFPGTVEAYARFGDDGNITGNGGCNRFSGNFQTFDKDQVRIGPLISTRKACEKELMEFEEAFLTSLQESFRWRRVEHRLQLLDDSGEVLLEMEPREGE